MRPTVIRLPRVRPQENVLDAFGTMHETLRDVAAWASGIVDDEGRANPRDARWLRTFLTGPLAWHQSDEDALLAPALLGGRDNRWLSACAGRMAKNHTRVTDAAFAACALLDVLAAGDPVPPGSWRAAAAELQRAIAVAATYEDEVVLPAARLVLENDERDALHAHVRAADETRPWQDAQIAGDVPTVHRVHAVRSRTQNGLDVVRSFAECPRRRTAPMETCLGCEHLDEKHVEADGTGWITCAIDDAPPPRETTVGDVMTRDVSCVERDASLLDATRMLADGGVSGLPVVDDAGRPIGVLSQSDVVAVVASAGTVEDRRVRDVMMHVPFVVREDDTVTTAAKLLLVEQVHRLPVIGGDGRVIGIVSTLDLLRATARSYAARAP